MGGSEILLCLFSRGLSKKDLFNTFRTLFKSFRRLPRPKLASMGHNIPPCRKLYRNAGCISRSTESYGKSAKSLFLSEPLLPHRFLQQQFMMAKKCRTSIPRFTYTNVYLKRGLITPPRCESRCRLIKTFGTVMYEGRSPPGMPSGLGRHLYRYVYIYTRRSGALKRALT